MKTTVQRLLRACLGLIAGSLLFSGCLSGSSDTDHWSIDGVGPRMSYNFLGYRRDLEGDYRDFQWREKRDVNLTLRRHFLNSNPLNPFQGEDPSLTAPRPPHSILPDPLTYFHLESVVIGLAFLVATDVFIPIPIGSLLATLDDGGAEEFAGGIVGTITGSYGGRIGEPAPVEEFRVRNF